MIHENTKAVPALDVEEKWHITDQKSEWRDFRLQITKMYINLQDKLSSTQQKIENSLKECFPLKTSAKHCTPNGLPQVLMITSIMPTEINTSKTGTYRKRVDHGLKGANTTTELCPPNPKEFEMATNKKKKERRGELRFSLFTDQWNWEFWWNIETYQHSLHAAAFCLPLYQIQLQALGSVVKRETSKINNITHLYGFKAICRRLIIAVIETAASRHQNA